MTTHPVFFEQPQFSYRGRVSHPLVTHPRRWAIAGLMVAVLFSTGAAATKFRIQQPAASGHSLTANVGLRPFGNSFAELAW